jgi:hypothetical protein
MQRAQPVGQILPKLGFTEHAMLCNSFNLLFSWIIRAASRPGSIYSGPELSWARHSFFTEIMLVRADGLPRKERRGLRLKNSSHAETDTSGFGLHSSARSYVRRYRRWTLDEVSSLNDAVERSARSTVHIVITLRLNINCTLMKVSKQAR